MDINKINTSSPISPIVNGIVPNTDGAGGEKFDKLLETVKNEKDSAKLEKACRDLEGVFVSMVFKQMNSSVKKGGLIDEGYAGGIYRDMLSEKYADEAVKGNGIGIAKTLFKQLSAAKVSEV